jgi:hypothetical protein
VNDYGDIYFNKCRIRLGRALGGELVGVREIDDDFYTVHFMNHELGTADLRRRPARACLDQRTNKKAS